MAVSCAPLAHVTCCGVPKERATNVPPSSTVWVSSMNTRLHYCLILHVYLLCSCISLKPSTKGGDFIANTGFTRSMLQGCWVPQQGTHVCRECWKKSLTAKEMWEKVVRPFQTFDPEAKNERASRHQLSDEVMVPVMFGVDACPHMCPHIHTSQGLFETRNAANKKDTKAVTDRPTVDIISALIQAQLPSFSKMVLAPNSPTRAALLARLEVELRNEVQHSHGNSHKASLQRRPYISILWLCSCCVFL